MALDELTRLQQKIALSLLDTMEKGDITPARCGKIARHVLKLLPAHLTDREVRNTLPDLGDVFPELAEVVKHYYI